MKSSLIDTDIISYFLKGDGLVSSKVISYLEVHDKLMITEISYFEILAGLEFKNAEKPIQSFEEFVTKCEVLKLSYDSIRTSAWVYGELRRKGISIGMADLLISGIAIVNDLNLVTNNEKHYQHIDSLILDNWRKNSNG